MKAVNLCVWIFHRFKTRPSLTSESLLINMQGSMSSHLSEQMRKLFDFCSAFVNTTANNDSSQQQRRCEDQSRKRWDSEAALMRNQKTKKCCEFINCFEAKAHNPICLQSLDGCCGVEWLIRCWSMSYSSMPIQNSSLIIL